MLFARGESEDEAAIAGGVGGLAGQAAGHLADVLFARGDYADVWAAVTGRDAEGLAFHGDDVGFRRRADDAERDGFGDRREKQRALCVRDFSERGKVFEDAEEIRRLHDYGGCFCEGFWLQRARSSWPDSV